LAQPSSAASVRSETIVGKKLNRIAVVLLAKRMGESIDSP
jgi:hypothetical protein